MLEKLKYLWEKPRNEENDEEQKPKGSATIVNIEETEPLFPEESDI